MKNKKTKIIAHRGFSAEYPENTLLAFQKAIEIGADFIEIDVHKTKDGVLIVIHDESIDRTNSNNEKGIIAEMNFEEVSKIDVGYSKKFGEQFKNEKIPTLLQVLELAKGKIKVCIEIKILNAEKEILKIVEEVEMEKEVVIFSFYEAVLENIRVLNQNIPTLFLVENFEINDISIAKNLQSFAIGVGNETTVNKDLVNLFHQNDVELWQWTIDDETEIQRLLQLEIDGLISNQPKIALALNH